MLRAICCALIAALASSAAIGADPAADLAADRSPVDVPVVGYSAQGMFAVVAEGLTEVVRREYPGSSFLYEPGNPAGGVVMIATGQRAFAIQTPTEIDAAIRGEAPFERAYPEEDFRPIARIVEGFATHVYARKAFLDQHNITSLADIKARKIPLRVSVNQKGNLVAQGMARKVLGHYGISYEDIADWGGEVIYLPTRASHDLMRNGKLDVVITGGIAPNSQITELVSTTPIRLLEMPQGVIDAMVSDLGMEPYVIPQSAYPTLLDKDMPTAAAYFQITAGPAATDADAYKIVRALHRHFDYYRSLHPVLGAFAVDMLPKVGRFKLQPGAAAYYREIGLVHTPAQQAQAGQRP